MNESSIGHRPTRRDCPLLNVADPIAKAVDVLVGSGLPALPVVDDDGKLMGIFGEREFFIALFPGYLSQMSSGGFIPRALETVLEKRATCRDEPVSKYMNTEHVDLGTDFSDTGVAETFLHHRVLIVPIVADDGVVGVIARADFFRATAARFLKPAP